MAQNNRNRKKRKKGGGGNMPFSPTLPALPESPTLGGGGSGGSGGVNPFTPAAPPPSGQGSIDPADATNQFLHFIAQERPQEHFGSQLVAGGQVTGSGPGVYENWLQNQFYNQNYLDYTNQVRGDPQLAWDSYIDNKGGPGGLAAEAQNQYNALTPYQRGLQHNPFSAGSGRFAMWS